MDIVDPIFETGVNRKESNALIHHTINTRDLCVKRDELYIKAINNPFEEKMKLSSLESQLRLFCIHCTHDYNREYRELILEDQDEKISLDEEIKKEFCDYFLDDFKSKETKDRAIESPTTPPEIIVTEKAKPIRNKDNILESISKCAINGNRLELPKGFIMPNYKQVSSFLQDAGGKYSKNGFIFKEDAQVVFDRIMSGEKHNYKQIHQTFFTPLPTVLKMIKWLDIQPSDIILEPSAGDGNIAEEVVKHNDIYLYCIDKNPLSVKVLKEKGFHTEDAVDFISWEPHMPFNKIIANPPFTRNTDLKHIYHMYDILEDGGRIVTLLSSKFMRDDYPNDNQLNKFRSWISDKTIHKEILPKDTFKSEGTTWETSLLVLRK